MVSIINIIRFQSILNGINCKLIKTLCIFSKFNFMRVYFAAIFGDYIFKTYPSMRSWTKVFNNYVIMSTY